MKGKGIALQLYTVREPAKADLAGTLHRAREAGYEYVQWSGMPDLAGSQILAALDAAGLKAVAGHAAVEPFEQDFDKALEHWKAVGVSDLAPGGMMKECRDTTAAWYEGAKRLERLGARLRQEGIRYSYHNHAFEFEKLPGDDRFPLDILYEETASENLYCELDTAWVFAGGQDPAEYLRKYAGRCPVIHVKDVHPDSKAGHWSFTELGRGLLDWNAVFAAARDAGVEWYIYEQDTCDGDPLESARISYEFLAHNLS